MHRKGYTAVTSRTLHLVSHTHWDREWYMTFQQFRLRLVALMDKLLDLLPSDPEYRHFMLDGQTIVLDDYLAVRPDKEDEIRRFIQAGRMDIGPWHILADEFLVSPESLVRNLLLGKKAAHRFGARMDVGYAPDLFGHIGQLPQILRGFGLESAVLRRGLADEPLELQWEAPDGTRVLLCYLRDGYGNVASLPVESPPAFVAMIAQARDSLAPHAATPHLLLLNGTDHHEAQPGLPKAMAYAAGRLGGDRLVHSTLPDYVAAVRASDIDFPVVRGDLRECKRHHLIPGVLSTRMWIKQRNEACQTLLEAWAEPFSCWAGMLAPRKPTVLFTGLQPADRLHNPGDILWLAWRRLLENHPHDSICGCSVDQVHAEMATRFDEVEQIGEEITRQSLETLAAAVDTSAAGSVVVFNPTAGPRSDVVEAIVELPGGLEEAAWRLVDEHGQETAHEMSDYEDLVFVNGEVTAADLQAMMAGSANGWVMDMAVQVVRAERQGDVLRIEVLLSRQTQPDPTALAQAVAQVQAHLGAAEVNRLHLLVRLCPRRSLRFVARDLPGFGYKTWTLQAAGPASRHTMPAAISPSSSGTRIENEYYTVEADATDGTLTVTDRQTGAVYGGLNRFADGGDRGDVYTFCKPERDRLIAWPVQPPETRVEVGPVAQALHIGLLYRLPAALAAARDSRSSEQVDFPIQTRISLSPGVRRVDIHTVVDNSAADHRLRVFFPAPLAASSAQLDRHYDLMTRPLDLPAVDTSDWIEQPAPEQPQRRFVDVSDGRLGLLVANRGLPEVEIIAAEERTTVALTLLRCVGWLSRGDMHSRRGHAGPALTTPGAQCPGRQEFDYALVPHAGDWRAAFAEGHAFAAPLRAVSTGRHGGELPAAVSMVAVEPTTFVLSAIKQAEDGQGWIVRGYSLADDVTAVRLRPWRRFSHAARVRLDEEWLEELVVAADGSVELAVRSREAATVRFRA